jgi:drug/metabolite transporter (DMT)-like permease
MFNSKTLKAELLLALAAVIWGFAFVAQRVGMEHVGPFTYNGVRFLLGALVLLPLLLINRPAVGLIPVGGWKSIMGGGLLAGLILFAGASLQQVGIVYTTAGKAGFITGLYVVIVPLLGLLWGHRTPWSTWTGATLAAIGLYLLTMTDDLSLAEGDRLVLLGALFWALHVLAIGWLSGRHVEPVLLASLQFVVCAVLSLATAVVTEPITLTGLQGAALPILYGGLLSVGVAYTLQVIAQRDAPPSHAAIILSLETVFAALAGWLWLNEALSGRGLAGGALMFVGMLWSQWGLGGAAPSPAEPVAVPAASKLFCDQTPKPESTQCLNQLYPSVGRSRRSG